MKQKIFTLILFTFFIGNVYAQNTWIQRANFANPHRERTTGFSIGPRGYFGLGYDGLVKNDFWEYNPNTNVWTQKANFGGSARSSAVGFAIGNKGYVGTGFDGILKNDFWEYNPVGNVWTPKAPLPANPRTVAIGFSIGNKGYIGTGSGFGLESDFWEYNPGTNSWTAKANYGGGGVAGAVGFSIGNKGYIGTGNDAGGNKRNDFWEYNPGNNTWIQKANFGGTARLFAAAFSIGNRGYIGTGTDNTWRNDFWEYDTLWNTWTQRANVGGFPRLFAAGFSIGNSGFLGSGVTTGDVDNDFWEYTPLSELVTNPISGSPFCAGSLIQVSYTTTNIYNAGNIFSAELSDAAGSFANPVVIGTLQSTISGTIQCTIPQNTPAGNLYRIRVSSSLPFNIGTDNGANLLICSVTWPLAFSPVCVNSPSFMLSGGMPANGIYSGPGVVDGAFDPSLVAPGTYTLTYTVFSSSTGCLCSATNTITVLPLPEVTWPVSFAPVCGDVAAFSLNGGLPAGGIYSGPGVDAFGNFNPTQVPFGTFTLTYTYTDAFGCTNTATNTIEVVNCINCGECYTPDTNLIVNGDFSSGNAGFISFLPNNCTCLVGSYCVTTDSYLKCNSFFHINDHTTGNGNYMVVDGSTSSNVIVWQQNVSVASGTTYTFSFWVHPEVSFITQNPILNIFIDNVSQALINTALLPNQWNNIVISWTSGLPSTIPIAIRQTNGSNPGMDYGLDDFSFNACKPNAVADGGADRIICSGDTIHLGNTNNLLDNNWYEINTGDPANYPFVGTGNVVVSPTTNTCYLLVACDGICCDTDSVCIDVNPLPVVTWPISFADVCTNSQPLLLTMGLPAGGTYSGSGVSGNYFDPTLAALGTNVLYYRFTNSNGCTDSVANTIDVVHCVECGPCFTSWPDLAVNGDFENGNTGFASTLSLNSNCAYTSYFVVNTANQKCNLFNVVPDHTTGTGKFMAIDGDRFQPMDIWTETVNVTMGNTYKFSFWMHPALSGGPGRADIDMVINGSVQLSIVGQNVPNQWTNFIVSWVANINGPIPITLRQSNYGDNGFDYGFDDIVFKECNPLVVVTWPVAFVPICTGQQPFLLTGGMPTGGTYSGPGVNGLGYFDPALVPFGTILLTYSYTDPSGCSNSITNTITYNDTPKVSLPEPFSVCNTDGAFSIFTNPTGGVYTGNITSNGTFDPYTAPLGNNLITYTYTDPLSGCSNSATTTITVVNCGCCDLLSGPGAELIFNGDFESGNVGFTIDPTIILDCNPNACTIKSYCVTTSALLKCQFFQNIKDHTTGQGKYLITQGIPFSNWTIWEQNVSVIANRKYTFAFWEFFNFYNDVHLSGPDLEVMINNSSVLIIDLPWDGVLPLIWTKYCTQWIADTTGIVSLKIRQIGNNLKERDYGIDDISFKECKPIGCNAIAGPDKNICPGENVTLSNLAGTACDWYKIVSPGNNIGIGTGDISVAPVVSTCYMLVCCTPTCCDTDTVCISMSFPDVTWPVSFAPVCSDILPFALNGGLPAGGVYSGPGVDAFGNFNPANVPLGQNTITYTYTNNQGCSASVTNVIDVIRCIDCGLCFHSGPDQVLNGDFESGNTGFTSELPMSCICATGTYCVSSSAVNKCNTFFNIPDHTSGTGNYLIIDGSQSQNNVNVWKQNVPVISGRTYVFSFWIHPALSNGIGKPDIDIVINNQSQLSITTQFSPPQWVNNTYTWVANITGTIQIALKQTNGGSDGYDFGIDDISFIGCVPNLDVNAGQDVTICLNASTPLNANIPGPYANITWSPPAGLSCTGCINPIASPTVTTTYTIAVTAVDGCIYSDQITITVIDCFKIVHLKAIIEGFYTGNGKMMAVSNPSSNPSICDTISVELHHATSPYNLAYSDRKIIDINGEGDFEFPLSAIGNSYYIVVKHRNALETWSAVPVYMEALSVNNYDFSDAGNKSFGNSLKDLGDGKFAIYSGDVDQNGLINQNDLLEIESSALNFIIGYLNNDITGDWIIESSDQSLIENNLGIILQRP